ncbi:GNAT family N-acetyltransferase [Streptomyces fuscigenes]|uniref:GNAT family N-acetyltransferase n=1 Tax=Streptomyces fuscigenes TaxID=1528880 RepID=UPI001F160AA4|nr:GNAT family N-acetyltransferase [Streptomyces fuscigenes]MCF3962877.1 GNAT family N-acetyltransferase [Streptomyces fuscigenes]
MDLAPFLPLTTARLTLRPFTPKDVDDMYAYQGLPEVARYLYRPPRTREQCEAAVARSAALSDWTADGDELVLAVTRTDTPGVIGETVLKCASAHARQTEIGWALHPAHAGRGYATEAATALGGLAFGVLGTHRLFARLDVENTPSVRLCERLGMRREAHLVENDLDGTRWGSEYVYAALAHELRQD